LGPPQTKKQKQGNEQVQEVQTKHIVEVVEKHSDDEYTPLILGDFNVEPWNQKGGPGAIAVLTRAGFVDLWAAAHPLAADFASCAAKPMSPPPRGCGYTITTRNRDTGNPTIPDQRADYIFARETPELKLVDVWSPILDGLVVQNEFGRLSDHYPITASLRFSDSVPR
jgi:endonuclease/exonuclease/phosphatase family metal-dependent hydrolase